MTSDVTPGRPDRPRNGVLIAVAAGLSLTLAAVTKQQFLATHVEHPLRDPRDAFPPAIWAQDAVLIVLAAALGWLLFRIAGYRAERPRLTRTTVLVGALALAVGVASGVRFGFGSAFVGLAALAVVVWLGPGFTGRRLAVVGALLLTAFALRALTGLALGVYGEHVVHQTAVLDDEMSYHYAALQILDAQRTWFGQLHKGIAHLMGYQTTLFAAVYAVSSPQFMALRYVNALFGTLCIAIVTAIATRFRGPRAGLAAGWLLAVWPMAVLWTGAGLREAFTTFLALLPAWMLLHLKRSTAAGTLLGGLATVVVALVVLADVRPLVFLAVVLALAWVAVAHLVARGHRRLALLGSGALLLAALGFIGSVLPLARESLTARAIEYKLSAVQLAPLALTSPLAGDDNPTSLTVPRNAIVRIATQPGGALQTAIVVAYQQDPVAYLVIVNDGDTLAIPREQLFPLDDATVGWGDVFLHVADGVRLVFVPVAPWSDEPFRRQLATPDTLLWDAFFLLSVYGVWRQRRDLSPPVLYLVAYGGLLLIELAIASTNLGTTVRHRALLVPSFAVASAPLLVLIAHSWRVRLRHRAHPPAPMPVRAPVALEQRG